MLGLNEIDINILIDLYEIDVNNSGEKLLELANNYLMEKDSRERTQELASHLLKLERLNYIEFDGEPFSMGGRIHPKYKNNVLVIWTECIHITEKGIKLVDEARKTAIKKTSDKTKKILLDIGKTFYGEVKDILIKTIIEMKKEGLL